MSYKVQFAPEALDQLDAIEDFIAQAGPPLAAARYVDAIIVYCESLTTFPHRGIRRDDLLHGLRITNYRGTAVIAFMATLKRCRFLAFSTADNATKPSCWRSPATEQLAVRKCRRSVPLVSGGRCCPNA